MFCSLCAIEGEFSLFPVLFIVRCLAANGWKNNDGKYPLAGILL